MFAANLQFTTTTTTAAAVAAVALAADGATATAIAAAHGSLNASMPPTLRSYNIENIFYITQSKTHYYNYIIYIIYIYRQVLAVLS